MSSLYIHGEDVHNFSAAQEIVPVVMEQVNPSSVLDVGCGIATWLKVFADHNVTDILGIDGKYVDRSIIKIPLEKFRPVDLAQPWDLGRKYDLVVCLEVAEHLPETSAETLVKCLCQHADTILFSAAIPGQAGQNHLNEQWPKYWSDKFREHGYYFHDILRLRLWNNTKIDWWYRQNIFLVTKKHPADENVLSLVHPACFEQRISNLSRQTESLLAGNLSVFQALKILVKSFLKLLKIRA